MYTIDILNFLTDFLGHPDLKPDDDLFKRGVYGDDFHEMIDKYVNRFHVNADKYLWYFHTCEEGNSSVGGIFFKAPNQRVTRIPVTPEMLLEFANKGFWNIDYPEHTIPKKRIDLFINKIILIVFLLLVVLYWLKK